MGALQKIIILMLTICSFSCATDKKEEKERDIVNLSVTGINEDYKFLKSSEILDLKRMVPLETTDSTLIGEIQRIRIQDSLIFVMDRTTKSALLFDNTGKFITKIGAPGRGPHETISLSDIAIDKYANRLLLVDRPGKKILAYSFQGGFEEVIPLSDWFDKMYVLNADEILLYSGNESLSNKRFTIIDKTGKVLSRFNEIPHEGLHGYRNSMLAGNPDTLLYVLPFDNTLYTVENKKAKAKYRIDFNGLFVTKEAKFMTQAGREKIMNKDDDGDIITQIDNVFVVNNVLYFYFNHRYQRKSVFFDINTGKQLKAGELRSDIHNLIFANRPPIGQTSNELIFVVHPSKAISRYKRLLKNPEYAPHLEQFSTLFENDVINENSNPVLFFYKIKS